MVVSTDSSLSTCIWSVDSPSPLHVLPSPSPLTLFSGVWGLGRESEEADKKWNFIFSSSHEGTRGLGCVVVEEEGEKKIMKEEEIKTVISPLCLCTEGEEVWVGGEEGEMAIFSLKKEKKEDDWEIKEWRGHGGQSVNGIVSVDNGVGGYDVWSCGDDGCVYVWKGSGGLADVMSHKKNGVLSQLAFCAGMVRIFFFFLIKSSYSSFIP